MYGRETRGCAAGGVEEGEAIAYVCPDVDIGHGFRWCGVERQSDSCNDEYDRTSI
jgi:hypothetical protein